MKNSKVILQEEGDASSARSTLVYDATCPICSQAVDWIGKNSNKNAFKMLPCQSDTLEEKFPAIGREACMQALHLVLPDGRKYIGEKALPLILEKTTRYRSLAILFKLPGVMFAFRIFYNLVAGRRHRISDFLHLSLPK